MKISYYVQMFAMVFMASTISADVQCRNHKFKGTPKVRIAVHASSLSRLPPNLDCLALEHPEVLDGITWYRNDEFDTWLAVNPTNHNNMIIVAQADTLEQSIPLSVIALYTVDGGDTWFESDLVLSRCQGATLEGANDNFQAAYFPSVSFGPDGVAYVISSSYNFYGSSEEGNIIATSTDGGASWTRVTAASRDDSTTHFYDSPRITADPFKENKVYFVASDQLCNVGGVNNVLSFFKSNDAAATWSEPTIIDQTPCPTFFFFSQLNVLPDNHKSLFVTSVLQRNGVDNVLGVADDVVAWLSEDRGDSWNKTFVQANVAHVLPIDPATSLPLMILPSQDTVVNPCNGHIYVVYSNPQFNPTNKAGLVISMSTDKGATWSVPLAVNPQSLDAQAFLPSVAVAQDGTVGVLFYDTRNFTPGSDILATDVWVSFFSEHLNNYKGEVRLTSDSFDARKAVFGFYNNEHYISSYVKLVGHHHNNFVAAFSVVNSDCSQLPFSEANLQTAPTLDDCNRQDIIFAKIKRH